MKRGLEGLLEDIFEEYFEEMNRHNCKEKTVTYDKNSFEIKLNDVILEVQELLFDAHQEFLATGQRVEVKLEFVFKK